MKSLEFDEKINLNELDDLIDFAYNITKDLLKNYIKLKFLKTKNLKIIELQYNNGIKRGYNT